MVVSPRSLRASARLIVIAGVVLALLLLARRPFMSYFRAELAGVAYDRGLVMLRESPDEPNPYLDRALRSYQAALAWDSGNAHAWRKLGELYLLLGQNGPARDALAHAVDLHPEQPYPRVLLGDALDGLGMAQEAVEEWRSARGVTWRRDPLAVNLMKVADAHVQTGDSLSAIPLLTGDLLRYDPGNLFAVATTVGAYDTAIGGHHPLADPYRDAIEHFDLSAIRESQDPRYTGFQVRAVALLYQGGYWDGDRVANVVSYWAWERHPGALPLALQLRDGEPERAEWRALVAGVFLEMGRCAEATESLGPLEANAPAVVLRAAAQAWLCQARETGAAGDWRQATAALAAYRSTAPEDLFAIAGLAEAHERLGDSAESERFLALYDRLTDRAERVAAAQVLAADVEDVQLGPNLVTNGGFEEGFGDGPAAWTWSLMAGDGTFAPALFAGGRDQHSALRGSAAARVQGLWLRQGTALEAARAGFWQWDDASGQLKAIPLNAGGVYVVSLNYATERAAGGAPTLWLSYSDSPCWANDRGVADTGGEWRHMLAVCGPVAAGTDPLQPLVRFFGTGVALFDDIQIREAIVTP